MANRRTVFVLNIDEKCSSLGLFEGMYASLMKELKSNPALNVSTIVSVNSFNAQLSACNPNDSVLLCVNEFIVKKRNLHDTIKKFATDGGLIILGCLFSSFTTPPQMDALFGTLNLPWKTAAYNRTTFEITGMGKNLLHDQNIIQKTFSVKAVQLAHVTDEQKLYRPMENATTESLVFESQPADQSLAMAAFGKIGSGAVAYIGDVNGEAGSNCLTVALCLARW